MSVFGAANVLGAAVVFSYLSLTGQENLGDVRDDVARGAVLLVVYFALVGVAGGIGGAMSLASVDWWYEERRPSDEERLATLRLPARFALLSGIGWTGGAVVFGIAGIAVGDGASDIVRTAVGTVLGGCTTAATCYLVVERVLRPVFAEALVGGGPLPMTTVGVRPRLALAWILGSGIPLLGIALSPIRDDGSTTDLAVLAGIGLVSGAVLIGVATRSVSDRLASLRDSLARVREGDLTVVVPVDEAGEVGTLQAGVNAMVHGLRERQVLADLFGRYVGPEVARHALREGVHLGGEQRDVSVLFLDVTGSTWLAATRPATEVVSMLNRLYAVVVRVVGEEGGWVDKFEGDAALCVFGAPAALADHPTHALRAARRLRDEVGIDLGIGVSSGTVVAGNIGSEARLEYTVIGDPVNEAARLTEAAKTRPGRVLAACRSVDRASQPERDLWVAADTLPLRGRPEPTATSEPRRSSIEAASPSPNT